MSGNLTRTRGVRIAATGFIHADVAKRLWGYYVNVGSGSLVIRDGGAAGAVIWDVVTVLNQWVQFNAPVVATHPGPAGEPGSALAGGLHVTLAGGLDITFQVDF